MLFSKYSKYNIKKNSTPPPFRKFTLITRYPQKLSSINEKCGLSGSSNIGTLNYLFFVNGELVDVGYTAFCLLKETFNFMYNSTCTLVKKFPPTPCRLEKWYFVKKLQVFF